VLKGLVTAEEAQDYPAHEVTITQARPTPEVRPKTDTDDRADPVAVAKGLIEDTNDIAKLTALRSRIDQRLKEKVLQPFEADELLDMIHAKIEFLEAQQEVTA
jgi:hypothetical protein